MWERSGHVSYMHIGGPPYALDTLFIIHYTGVVCGEEDLLDTLTPVPGSVNTRCLPGSVFWSTCVFEGCTFNDISGLLS